MVAIIPDQRIHSGVSVCLRIALLLLKTTNCRGCKHHPLLWLHHDHGAHFLHFHRYVRDGLFPFSLEKQLIYIECNCGHVFLTKIFGTGLLVVHACVQNIYGVVLTIAHAELFCVLNVMMG